MPVPDEDHALLNEAVREAGALAMTYFNGSVKTWDKPDGTPVSEADIAVDGLLHEQLTDARPDYGWLSEEQEDNPEERLKKQRVWIVDPIDGTRAFLKQKPHFVISAALVDDGVPIAAAIFNPATEEFFEATQHKGACLNGEPIHVTNTQKLEGCRMVANPDMFHHPGWRRPWPSMEAENRNSIAYRLALVASGAFDATMHLSSLSDWDIAAAHLILTETGGLITCHNGNSLTYNQRNPSHISVVGANPSLHAALMAQVGDIVFPSSKKAI
ncbi:MAG: 3'(2'),5'-bisphosphate nucleotidase CysQ [Parvularculales bacterium]